MISLDLMKSSEVRIAGDRSNHLIVNRIAKKFSILSMINSRADGGSVILLAN